MLNTWINEKYLNENKINSLKDEFKSSPFFSHLSLNDFLIKEKAQNLLKELKKEDYYLEENDLYKFFRTIDFKNSNNEIIIEFRNFLLSNEFRKFIEEITNSKINDKKMDLHSLKLENTNYLLCHDDFIENRKFAFIFNFTKNFTKEDGGELEFFESENNMPKGKIFKSIIPKFNQFNIFKVSENSFHQINEVETNKKRISISGWYYPKN